MSKFKLNDPRRKTNDVLPRTDRFCPADPDEALLAFGETGDKTFPNYFVPTDHLPGSMEKIEVMRIRAERGLPLWHPHDRVTYESLGNTKVPKRLLK